MSSSNLVHLSGIRKSFRQPTGETVEVLKGIDLTLRNGETASIVGPSGSGKSTLLQIIGLMEKADAGSLELFGKKTENLKEAQRDQFRRKSIHFLFQFDSLLEELTVEENLALAWRIKEGNKLAGTHFKHAVSDMLSRLGLSAKAGSYPRSLSGGEKTRANIARSLLGHAKLILADEPTGNLDPKNAKQISQEFIGLAREASGGHKEAMGIILVTHNMELARMTDNIYRLNDGKLEKGGESQ